MKVLIENAVPLNNGDAALIFSVGEKFEKLGFDVSYSTFNIDSVKKVYPEKKWLRSLLDSKLIRIPYIGFFILMIKVMTSRKYREYDAIISAPGGYINSFYGFKKKVQLLSMYKMFLNKKVYMYSQSVGPLNKKDEKILIRYLRFFDYFYTRDDISMKRMVEIGQVNNVYQTKDAAFLLETIKKTNKNKNKRVAISVREWKHDNRSEDIYIDLIKKIVIFFAHLDYNITFISTCQGNPTYTNDANMALKISESLPEEIKEMVNIDSNYYRLEQLRKKLTEFDYVIGTRLHMCILSWLSETPAFNISYEEKGKECYKYLKIEDYSIDYNYEGEIEPLLLNFIKGNHHEVLSAIQDIQNETNSYLEKMLKNIKE